MNKRFWTLVAVLGMAAVLVTLVASCQQSNLFGSAYTSNGERIYYTTTNDQGEGITYSGGPAFGGMMMGSQLACASCHGQDASGGVHLMMMQVMDAPDIRWLALSGEMDEEDAAGDGHDDEHAEIHAEYDIDTFRLAVVEGEHPNGDPLSNDMPRWNLSEDDLEDLAAFLNLQSIEENSIFPGNFSIGSLGMTFPIIGLIVVLTFMLMMMSRMGFIGSRKISRRAQRESDAQESADEILKKRYAKGEISKQEYEEMKDIL